MRISAVAIAMVVAAAAVPALAAGDVTVGQFIQQLAMTKKLNSSDARTAADSLEAAGVKLPSGLDYSSGLTEGTVTSISRSAGLNVRSSNPERAFSSDQMDRFFMSFSRELSVKGDVTVKGDDDPPGVNPPSSDNSQRGKGKKKGHGKGKGKGSRTPSEPE
jgi:beta-lactam-binding protein with PASTA domain